MPALPKGEPRVSALFVRQTAVDRAVLRNVQILVRIFPLPAGGGLFDGAAVFGQEADDVVGADPDLAVAFLLVLVKDQLDPKMQVNGFDVIHIFVRIIQRWKRYIIESELRKTMCMKFCWHIIHLI